MSLKIRVFESNILLLSTSVAVHFASFFSNSKRLKLTFFCFACQLHAKKRERMKSKRLTLSGHWTSSSQLPVRQDGN